MIECIPFNDSGLTAQQWDDFADTADNGTIFHKRKFLSYHPLQRFDDHSLIFMKRGNVLALFPAALQEKEAKNMLVSHPGASYGGIVYPLNLPLRDAYAMVESLVRYAGRCNFHALQLTVPPLIYQLQYAHYIDYALIRHDFRYQKREVSSIVQLDTGQRTLLQSFRPEARTAVNKALKQQVSIRDSERFEEYYPILKKNLKLRHNVSPTHTLDELIRLRQLFPEDIRLTAAFVREKMAAGVVHFRVNPRVLLAFYISHDEAYQQYRPLNLLFYELMITAKNMGYRFLDFGLFTVNMDPNFGLARFKENFGARGIFRDTFYGEL